MLDRRAACTILSLLRLRVRLRQQGRSTANWWLLYQGTKAVATLTKGISLSLARTRSLTHSLAHSLSELWNCPHHSASAATFASRIRSTLSTTWAEVSMGKDCNGCDASSNERTAYSSQALRSMSCVGSGARAKASRVLSPRPKSMRRSSSRSNCASNSRQKRRMLVLLGVTNSNNSRRMISALHNLTCKLMSTSGE